VIRADRPAFIADSGKFCGAQHANMAMLVIAEPPDQYDAWLARQRQPAPIPTDTLAMRGQSVLEGGSCAMCHSVASTRAAGGIGPDLTHVAGRRTIAAGTLANTTAILPRGSSIPDAQAWRRYARECAFVGDLRALLAYLRTLR
jgi:cytochrome c oxidase subunit 2